MSYYEPPDVDDGPDEPEERPTELHHVHNCLADREQRHCEFEWPDHIESTDCQCSPTVDESNKELSGEVFIVHRGVC